MKRDQSLIFTTVPEEDVDQHSPINIQEKITETKSPDRPRFLNLKNKTTDSKFDASRNETKPVPSTPFLGQTSVCSTPMTDLNKVIHPNIMSICVNPEEIDKTVKENLDNSSKTFANVERMHSVNTNFSDVTEKLNNDEEVKLTRKLSSCIPYIPIENNIYDKKKNASMWEMREKLKSFNKRVTMRYYSLGLPNLNDHLEIDLLNEVPKKISYRTISDPLYPIFKPNGVAVSNYLYNQYLEEPINFLDLELEMNKNKNDSTTNTEEWKSVEDVNNFWPSPKKSNSKVSKSPQKNPEKKFEISPPVSKESRKSLTLPLKSLASSTEQPENLFSPATRSRSYGGVQLTPLMSKLSLLAMEEKSSGFCSRDTTPGDFKDVRLTPSQSNYSFLTNRRKSSVSEELEINKTNLHEVVLFICGQQDMVMGLLLDVNIQNSPEVINQLVRI